MMNATKMKVCRGPWNAARILAALLFAACLLIGIALADPPQYLPLQGQLTDQNGRIIQSGSETYTYKVVLYDSPDSVNALWQDTFANQTIINGVFNVMLGSQIPLTQALFDKLGANGVLYVGITITGRNGIGVPGGGVEMRPRLTLVSVPFSLQANKAKTADTATNATNADKAAFASNAGQLQGSAIDDILARVKIPELNVGTILETYGGAAEQAIDPRTLDLDGDGKTTAPLSIAKTLKGIDVPTSMTKWMVCVQNANKNLRFPNTAEIDSSLRNALIPEKALTMGRVSNETYVWRNLIPATGGFTSTSALGAGMAYDPVLDAYWLTEGQGDHRKLSLIYRDASDATKVYIRSISLPSEAPSLNDQKKLDVVGRILVFGPSTSSQAGYDTPGFTLRIGGTDPTNATLTYISAATIGTADTTNRNPGGYFFNQNTSDFHYFNGTYLNNVSYWPQTHNIYHLTGENLGFLKSISSNGTNVFRQEYQDITTYDSVNNIGYKYGGYFLSHRGWCHES